MRPATHASVSSPTPLAHREVVRAGVVASGGVGKLALDVRQEAAGSDAEEVVLLPFDAEFCSE